MTEEYQKLNATILKALVEAVQNHIIFIERHNLEILARAVATALTSQQFLTPTNGDQNA